MKIFKKSINIVYFRIFSIFLFSILFLPFINSIPYLDGNIDLVRSYDFYAGGFTQYFQNWGSVHPPLKLFATNLLFHTLGIYPFSYNLIGYILGLVGIIAIYKLCESVFDKKTAIISSILLSTYPLFIAVGLFGLTDYIVSILILISLNFYARKNYLIYSVFACLAVLTKETALLFPLAVLFIEIVYCFKYIKQKIKNLWLTTEKIIYLVFPFITYYLWNLYIQANGQKAWNDWNFSSTADKGSLYTIINNLLTSSFLNDYAYQHWKQVFILNFNWILWIFFLSIFLIYLFTNLSKIKKNILSGKQNIKTLIIIMIFCLVYLVTVLSFQTYTIPRYALPVVCLFLVGLSWSLSMFFSKVNFFTKITLSFLLGVLILLRLFYSLDPISLTLWGQENILGLNFFGLNNHLAGNDGITYNMQYLFVVGKRSNTIKSANNYVLSNQCNWIFPDPNNDYKTMKILNLNINTKSPCIDKTYGK